MSNKRTIYNSIYYFHILKAGGTSINFAFIRFFFNKKYKEAYAKISSSVLNRIVSPKKKVVIGWNRFSINHFNFSYAWSHQPYKNLNLKSSTFKFVIFRDPSERIISYYKEFLQNKKHPAFKKFKNKNIKGIIEFINLLPKSIICNQLYIFSKKFNLDEAKKNLNNLNLILFQKDLKKNKYSDFKKFLNISKLKFKHERKSKISLNLNKKEKEQIRKKVKLDKKFYDYALSLSRKHKDILRTKIKIIF